MRGSIERCGLEMVAEGTRYRAREESGEGEEEG